MVGHEWHLWQQASGGQMVARWNAGAHQGADQCRHDWRQGPGDIAGAKLVARVAEIGVENGAGFGIREVFSRVRVSNRGRSSAVPSQGCERAGSDRFRLRTKQRVRAHREGHHGQAQRAQPGRGGERRGRCVAEALMQRIYVIATGGTIEKVYSEQTGNVQNLDSKIDRYFRMLRLPDADIQMTHLMNKDSLEMTDNDRARVLDLVREKLKDPAPIVITHGTDTMVETGLVLKKSLADLQVPIVLTGAMTPLGFEASDGLQNLTESLLAARVLSPGVYVVMHNQVFPVDRVRKDREAARFVWK